MMKKVSRGSTPHIIIEIPEGVKIVRGWLSISQGFSKNVDLVKIADVNMDAMLVTAHRLEFYPDQAVMLKLDPGMMTYFQFRGIDAAGHELHTALMEYGVINALHEEVI